VTGANEPPIQQGSYLVENTAKLADLAEIKKIDMQPAKVQSIIESETEKTTPKICYNLG
jgi:predicted GTPase